jgi:transcriptional regulator with XRE-family HTH domain
MKPQTEHMIDVLRTTIRALGVNLRDVEKRLGVSGGYLTRLFSGVINLKFDHIVEIAEAIGVEPEEILRRAFPPSQQPATPEALRVREALRILPLPEAQPPAAPAESSLERAIELTVVRTLAKMLARAQP